VRDSAAVKVIEKLVLDNIVFVLFIVAFTFLYSRYKIFLFGTINRTSIT
jgi:hypothetical protein